VHDASDVAVGLAAAAGAEAAGVEAGAVAALQWLLESVMVCWNWASMVPPSLAPYLLTRAALTWAAVLLAPEAGSTATTAIAFPNDMSRSKYPMAHESWLLLASAPDAAVNLLISACVHWPGDDPWAGPAGLPPPHAVTMNAVTATASGPARTNCFPRALLNAMMLPFI